jgi:predicted O-methyltransferase YrrM
MYIFKKIILKLLTPLIAVLKISLYYGMPQHLSRPTAIDLLEKRALESSAVYIEKNGNRAVIFKSRSQLWSFALNQITLNGIHAEFGVSWGKSITYFASRLPSEQTIFGFDSFYGLKEDFTGTHFTKGAFTTNGKLPKVPKNVVLLKGWFSEVLPDFLINNLAPFSFIHLDADTYESTKEVLDLIKDRINSGTIIIFDEYIGVPNWYNNEHKAWIELVEIKKFDYEYIAFSSQSTVLRIK